MARRVLIGSLATVLALMPACTESSGSGSGTGSGTPTPAAPAVVLPREELAGEIAVGRAGCARCHASAAESGRIAPVRGPALSDALHWHARDGGAAFLELHHGGGAASDLAAYVTSLSSTAALQPAALQPAATTEALIDLGERLYRELACGACHAPDKLAHLSGRTDHAHLSAFLQDPSEHRPGVVHDFGLSRGEAGAIAAWLLRMQLREKGAATVAGFAYEYFELPIKDGKLPDLEGQQPTAQGIVQVIDTAPRKRKDNFALRFRTTLDVPAAGVWNLTVGSDDGSWLWLDGKLVIDNGGLKPHGKRSESMQLDAGPHELEVVFTQKGGGQSLEVLWEGPGVDEQPIPGERGNAESIVLLPPELAAAPNAVAVARGREQAVARRCAACHVIDDPLIDELPRPAPAKPWRELTAFAGKPCPQAPAAIGLLEPALASLSRPLDEHSRLALALHRDDCLSCHVRDGAGGLPPAVSKHLVETEDIGEEGRLPPDLTRVGYRLRREWIEKVLRGGHRTRPYVRVRMPRVGAERAAEYAELFAKVDGGDVQQEPPFSTEAVEAGVRLAGVKGRNCISCHTFSGAPSLGPQGMDLAVQHERVRPEWFREWLLRAPTLRPGTRMPVFWPAATEEDRREIDAIRTWLSLGAAAPIPEGLVPEQGSLVLLPNDRPILHGAFLSKVSARCIAVGTSERIHYAFDVEHGRLAWVWRGNFLDATGTWHGRAGKLVKPLGADWLVLEDFAIGSDTEEERTVAGHRITEDGYPTFVVRSGKNAYTDTARPRLTASGGEIVRYLFCTEGELQITWPQQEGLEIVIGGEPAPPRTKLAADQYVEAVYRW